MRFVSVLGALALCLLAFASTAFAQEEADGPSGPLVNQMDDVNMGKFSLPYDTVYRRGVPFSCGGPVGRGRRVAVACRIEAKVTVPAKVASFLRLSSKVIANGVATTKVDRFEDDDGNEADRVYFLPLRASVKSKLRGKRVGALGVHIAGTVRDADASSVTCWSEDKTGNGPKRSECSFTSGKKALIYGGQDGELLCWRYMPWWLATPATWGKMCPRPVTTRI